MRDMYIGRYFTSEWEPIKRRLASQARDDSFSDNGMPRGNFILVEMPYKKREKLIGLPSYVHLFDFLPVLKEQKLR